MKSDFFLLGAAAVGAYWLYTKFAASVPAGVNPFSQDNYANTAANTFYQGVSGSQGSIGTDWWSLTNPAQAATDNSITAPTGGGTMADDIAAEMSGGQTWDMLAPQGAAGTQTPYIFPMGGI